MNIATLGTPKYNLTCKLLDKYIIKLHIIDTAGQEVYKALNECYYENADSIILSYDITRGYTFEECKNYYYETINKRCKTNIKVILIGNKKDRENEREVSFEEANEFALSKGYLFMETSCKTYENVYETFEKLIETTLIEIQKKDVDNSKSISKSEIKKKKNNNNCIII
jgi:small GTP-binding protein